MTTFLTDIAKLDAAALQPLEDIARGMVLALEYVESKEKEKQTQKQTEQEPPPRS